MADDAAAILHADLDAFFASVAQRDDPRLRGRPVAAGGGVVLAASYEARAFGVRGGMNGREAKRRCPALVFVPPDFTAYLEASAAVFQVFAETSPVVEAMSIDEAFLDVSGLRRIAGPPEVIGHELRRRVRDEVGLPISVGIAGTKFVAKVAGRAAKPDGLLVVPVGGERDFLDPLPLAWLWGIGPSTITKLHGRGLTTLGEVARLDEDSLIAMLGTGSGRQVHALAQHHDPRPVQPGRRRRSIGTQRSLVGRHLTFADLEVVLLDLVDRISYRLRSIERLGQTVTLRIRFADFTVRSHARSLRRPAAGTAAILEAARVLLGELRDDVERRGVTLLGINIAGLRRADTEQLELPFDARTGHRPDEAVDAVRRRYGSGSITRAALLARGQRDVTVDPGAWRDR